MSTIGTTSARRRRTRTTGALLVVLGVLVALPVPGAAASDADLAGNRAGPNRGIATPEGRAVTRREVTEPTLTEPTLTGNRLTWRRLAGREGGDPAPVPDDPAAGPYDPGFVDVPLATNPLSPRLGDVPAESDELADRQHDIEAAEERRDEATDHLAAVRGEIRSLDAERVRLNGELEAREATVVRRGDERRRATEVHRQRVADAEAALADLDAARAVLRELMVAAYVSESSSRSDLAMALTGTGNVDAAVLRLSLGEGAADGRVRDVLARLDTLDRARRRRDAARVERDEARAAEARAVEDRAATEAALVDNASDKEAALDAETAAATDLTERNRLLLVALADAIPARLRAEVVGDGIDFPLVALDAWVKASESAPCRTEWWMLAGISKIEGRHGTFGGGHLGARGYPSVRIIGPQLNGSPGLARIGDTDGGHWDGDTTFDRAVGPMQFIPSTWARWGHDGDGDGVADPFTIYDAAGAAARYLCAGRSDLTQEPQLRAGYFSYNHSNFYVAAVLAAAHGYRDALTVPPPPES